jgi:uncharacterized membrane protein HdeD (DUF308 family)
VSAPASPKLRWITAGLLLIAAALAIALPFVSSTLLTIALGGVAIAAGISQLLRLTSVEGKRGKVFRGLSALLYLVGGISLLAFPIQSTLSLTLFLGFLLAIEGLMELAAAAAGGGQARWLIAEWPLSGTWAIGTMFGIGLAFSALNLLTAPASPTQA